jgi:methylenetetrahydrofolate dehydrogenase (NADP+) / methenyltetrahydrofolate cyclohydrolase
MKILDGKLVSEHILNDIKIKIQKHKSESISKLGYQISDPSIAVVLVGNNPASESYVKAKLKACEKSGINSKVIRFDSDSNISDIYNEVRQLNKSSIDGFIVQLPLPNEINADYIMNEIDADKDIDGFHPLNFGKMALGQKSMRPATAYGILKLLEYYKLDTKGKHVVVIGRSNIVGKPISIMLGNDFNVGRATVTSCDINTPRSLLIEETRRADIVIIAVGKPGFLTSDMIREGSIIIDVGINRVDNKIVGDVDFESVSKICSWITPVPGGIGPMTIAALILNTYESWKLRNYINEI